MTGVAPIGRKPTLADFAAWCSVVYDHADEIDGDGTNGSDWNDMALGFLLARGVDHGFTNWELLSSYTCGDQDRMQRALDEIELMTAPERPDIEDEGDTDDDHGDTNQETVQ